MQLLINIFISSSFYLLIAYSFQIIFRSTKFFFIAHAISLTLGGYLLFFFLVQVGIHFILAVILALIVSTLICSGIGSMNNYSKIKKFDSSWMLLVVSLGLYIISVSCISIIWGNNPLRLSFLTENNSIIIFGAYITTVQLFSVLLIVTLTLFTYLFLSRTKLGKRLEAVSTNHEMSEILGIPKSLYLNISLLVGSFLGSSAGVLLSLDNFLTPILGFKWLLYGVITMIIGGLGKIRNLILGALLLASVQHLASYYIASKWMDASAFIILTILLLWKPYGFSGQKLHKAEI